MIKKGLSTIFTLGLLGCTNGAHFESPQHSELLEINSHQLLIERFGEPETIHRYTEGPDVASAEELRRSGLSVTNFERWIYTSVNRSERSSRRENGTIGKTVVTIKVESGGSDYVIQSIDWLTDDDYSTFVTVPTLTRSQ